MVSLVDFKIKDNYRVICFEKITGCVLGVLHIPRTHMYNTYRIAMPVERMEYDWMDTKYFLLDIECTEFYGMGCRMYYIFLDIHEYEDLMSNYIDTDWLLKSLI